MELEFQASDFERLMFRIDEMPDKVDPVDYYPKLKKWSEFGPQTGNKGMSIFMKNKVFRWIVLMYDKESPFRTKISDAIKRKLEVAKYVKLITSFNLIDPEVKEILQGNDEVINRMIVAYVRMHRDSLYALVVGLDEMYYKDLFGILNGDPPKKPIANTQKDLENAITELLNQDNNINVKRELSIYMEDERLRDYRPEGMAEILLSGKVPFEEDKF